jgi:hypothetical protein
MSFAFEPGRGVTQVAAIEGHQLALLSADKLRSLPAAAVAALSVAQLLALSPAQVRRLSLSHSLSPPHSPLGWLSSSSLSPPLHG